MDDGDQPNMARRLGWLSAAAGLTLALARMGRLLQPNTGEGPPWQLVLVAAAVLGAAFTWTAVAYRLPIWATVLVNAVGVTVAVLRVTAPETLVFGMVPTGDTFAAVAEEMAFAVELVRFGAAPVLPVAGLVALVAAVFWALASLAVAGLAHGRVLVATLAPLVFYLQLATLDREPSDVRWMAAFATILALVLVASAPGRRRGSGRVRRPDGGFLPRRAPGVTVVLAAIVVGSSLTASAGLASAVPALGVIPWRSQSGLGAGLYGGTSFNLFVGLKQSITSLSDEPMFVARVSDSAPPNEELYWKLITLDTFDGVNWMPSAQSFSRPYRGGIRWEREDWKFQGPTVRVAARIRIEGLAEQLLPTLYSPISLESPVPLISESFRVREDGSIGIDVRTKRGWEYEIVADVPQPDFGRLASVGGELSPIFAEAASAGVFRDDPEGPSFADRPDDLDYYLELPDDLPVGIRTLAREVTEGGVTRFEQASILEAWFRDPTQFRYSTDVTTGSSALDLEAWLTDPNSINYRVGYCEQFATSMAVMARALGIPSRVILGFAPGDVERAADGSEIIVVRERNAHSWVELWMDDQGWVRFDPTPRSDNINPATTRDIIGFDPRNFIPAPEDPETTPARALTGERDRQRLPEGLDIAAGDPTPDLRPTGFRLELPAWVWILVAAVAAVAAVPAYKLVRRRRRLRRLADGDVTAAWEEIVDRLRDLGAEVRPDRTPLEMADAHEPALRPLAEAYSAAAYGPPGSTIADPRPVFDRAEAALADRYERSRRLYGWFRPTSLRHPR